MACDAFTAATYTACTRRHSDSPTQHIYDAELELVIFTMPTSLPATPSHNKSDHVSFQHPAWQQLPQEINISVAQMPSPICNNNPRNMFLLTFRRKQRMSISQFQPRQDVGYATAQNQALQQRAQLLAA